MRALIGLGSNEGDRLALLRSAVASIDAGAIQDTHRVATSRIYETRPIGPSDGPYLNAAVELETAAEPEALLTGLKAIEAAHGRVRGERWAARTLDLDLLLVFDGTAIVRMKTPRLQLPHPQVLTRDFVMRPLLDLREDLSVDGHSIAARLEALADGERTILRALEEGLSTP